MKVTALVFHTDGTWKLEMKELPDDWFKVMAEKFKSIENNQNKA